MNRRPGVYREVITLKGWGGLTFAESANNTPILLFANGQDDLSSEVLNQLNSRAPE